MPYNNKASSRVVLVVVNSYFLSVCYSRNVYPVFSFYILGGYSHLNLSPHFAFILCMVEKVLILCLSFIPTHVK